ncbi:type IV toxin-antitoxin system AbiEi family antitoxin [Ferrimicrobium acidiphilum]|uniref:type IV toxin-antitoxin system AbiEi family antitoxin n=1 Tax=Ferrimicrobium acidiphilum TaxID=121039 RepID=UPI0023F05BFF|nr:hypothetical protein [Ferrimicrobium acidiphilum]
MRANELLQTLDKWDKHGIWGFDLPRLEMIFSDETSAVLKNALMRHAQTGIITRVARGIYVNPRARSMPAEPLLALVSIMRPFEFSYLSLESVLSDAGWISQVAQRYTLMSTGRSSVFYTPYGVLEFTHTSRTASPPQVVFDRSRGVHVATPERAYEDLRHVRRNLGMVEVPETDSV